MKLNKIRKLIVIGTATVLMILVAMIAYLSRCHIDFFARISNDRRL